MSQKTAFGGFGKSGTTSTGFGGTSAFGKTGATSTSFGSSGGFGAYGSNAGSGAANSSSQSTDQAGQSVGTVEGCVADYLISDMAMSADCKVLVISSWDPNKQLGFWRREKQENGVWTPWKLQNHYNGEKGDVILRVVIWNNEKLYFSTACGYIKRMTYNDAGFVTAKDTNGKMKIADAVKVAGDTGMIVGLKKAKEHLVSASNNGTVCIWDEPHFVANPTAYSAKRIFYMKEKKQEEKEPAKPVYSIPQKEENKDGEEKPKSFGGLTTPAPPSYDDHGRIIALAADHRNIAVCTTKFKIWLCDMQRCMTKTYYGDFVDLSDEVAKHNNVRDVFTCITLIGKDWFAGTRSGRVITVPDGKVILPPHRMGRVLSITSSSNKVFVGFQGGMRVLDPNKGQYDDGKKHSMKEGPVSACVLGAGKFLTYAYANHYDGHAAPTQKTEYRTETLDLSPPKTTPTTPNGFNFGGQNNYKKNY